ncbi:hypothetical protein CRYUN_Cryun26dG0037400 [Craigia yunnanensis]
MESSSSSSSLDSSLKQQLKELQKQLGKKQRFEEAVFSINSLLKLHYPYASPSLRKSFYSVVCRVATILKTRYTAPGFWLTGLRLFQFLESLVSDPFEKGYLRNCISQAKEHLNEIENPVPLSKSSQNRGYLFDGHLTVDPEPPQPQWLVQSNLMNGLASAATAESSQGSAVNVNTVENVANVLEQLINHFDTVLPEILENEGGVRRVPPASKEVVAKLPVITLTEEILAKLGSDAECAICKENLVVGDNMQELPCKHTFHPPCLKPWLDEHNSCPICRYELQTDDHDYESWKEREKEAEEERKGAANAVRGGEYIIGTFDESYTYAACCFLKQIEVFVKKPGYATSSYSFEISENQVKLEAPNLEQAVLEYLFAESRLTLSPTVYKRVDSCLIIPPSGNKKPRAIIKFLGGSFFGAVPEVTYSYLIKLLAKEGFLIISVPYNVTFDHEQVAKQVYERFSACLGNILAFGFPDADLTPADLVDLPIFSAGHSNGALLQVLTGSYFSEKMPKANAIISYNNRPAKEAVPYFEQLILYHPEMYDAVYDVWKMFIDTAGAMIPDRDQEALDSFTKFVDQLPSVFGQVTQGISEFKPTPSENHECCKNKYNIQHTLLVKFNFDTIDETDLLEETLKPRVESIGGTQEKVQLSGNHITPCVQEPKWQAGYVYTPADAIAQGLMTLSLNETKVLSRTITDWFRRFKV